MDTKEYLKKWRSENRDKIKEHNHTYYCKNKEKIYHHQCEYRKDNCEAEYKRNHKYYLENKKRILFKNSQYRRERRGETPWFSFYGYARNRCIYPSDVSYKYYGGRGIKFKLTKDDIKHLWFRDKAYLMEIPSIDRKNNDGDYKLENCRFLEKSENSRRRHNRGD